MKVIFCDLCGQPIKQSKWVLLCSRYLTDESAEMNNLSHYAKSQENDKEICETCKRLIDQIFEMRMKGILKLAKDLKHLYELPTKESYNSKRKKKT